MNNKEIIKKIKLLQGVKPSADWHNASRNVLLNKINQDVVQPVIIGSDFNSYCRFFAPKFFHALARPIGVIILIASIILGSGIVAVSASQNSLPGDYLYSIKITGEKVQSTLSTNSQNNLALEIKFANRRLAEIQQVNQSTESSDRKNVRVAKASNVLTQNLKNIQNNLQTINNNEVSADKVVAAANLVDSQVAQLNQDMDKETIPATEVQGLMDETFNQALDVWVDQYQNGHLNYQAKKDILNKVNVKINQTGEKIGLVLTELETISQKTDEQSAVAVTELSMVMETVVVEPFEFLSAQEEIKQKLAEAQDLLTEARKAMVTSDVVLAVNKLKQSKNNIVIAGQKAVEIKQALAQAAAENTEEPNVVVEDPIDLPLEDEINEDNNSTTVDLAPVDEATIKDDSSDKGDIAEGEK